MLIINYLCIFGFLAFYINVLPGHFEESGYTGLQRASILGVIPAITLGANIFWGRIADRYQKRVVLIKFFSIIAFFATASLFALDTYQGYLVMTFFLGIFDAGECR
jgi:MFS family permease